MMVGRILMTLPFLNLLRTPLGILLPTLLAINKPTINNKSQKLPSQKLPPEVPLKDALSSLLSGGKLSDLTLKSAQDGKELKVHRTILAARSPVFESMLYKEFSGASTVEMNYSGEILKAVMEHIYTEETGLLEEKNYKNKEELVAKIGSLIDASTCFALSRLCEKAMTFATITMQKDPALSVYWLSVCDANPILKDSVLEANAFDRVRKDPKMLLGEESIGKLSSSTIEKVIKCDRINANEITLFRILQNWANSNSDSDGKRKAEKMIKHVALDRINPQDLAAVVEPSGLVSTNQLLEAYRKQAFASTEQGVEYEKSRSVHCVWKSSKDVCFTFPPFARTLESLDCPPLLPGKVYKWSLFVEELTPSTSKECLLELGVASTDQEERTWLIRNDGIEGPQQYNPHRPDFGSDSSQIQAGSTIEFTLDLEGTGSLGLSVDGKGFIWFFSDMLSQLDDRGQAGFVPSIYFNTEHHQRCRVRFLGFDPNY